MRAMVYTQYGGPEVLRLTEVPKPTPADDEVLIQIYAASVNRSDWEGLIGRPLYSRLGGLTRPRRHILGSDIAGRVEAVGRAHTRFKPGDEVFGDILGRMAGFAEYVNVRGLVLALKPAGLTFAQAAAIPQAGVIALQGLRDIGRVQPGQHVLINGAGGGAGMFAVQLAKRYGATVTGVDNAGKLAFMRSLGADHVLDYARNDFTRGGPQYDLIIDNVAYRSPWAYARALKRRGRYYAVGGSAALIVSLLLLAPAIRRLTGKHVGVLIVRPNVPDLEHIAGLCAAGAITPVIDSEYPLEQVPEALRRVGAGRANGKVIVRIRPDVAP